MVGDVLIQSSGRVDANIGIGVFIDDDTGGGMQSHHMTESRIDSRTSNHGSGPLGNLDTFFGLGSFEGDDYSQLK